MASTAKAGTDDEFHPINILVNELRDDDPQARLNCVKQLSSIALALGPERTRLELIPFLTDTVYDEDEILMVLAQQLGNFIDLVGGKDYARILLPPLESLAVIEETVVRQHAIESLKNLAKQMPDHPIVVYFVPMVRRLATGEWFTSRASASSLFGVCYRRLKSGKEELRKLFSKLCTDESPIVRRAAAKEFGDFCEMMEDDEDVLSMIPILSKICEDDQDSVRLLALISCVKIAKFFSKSIVERRGILAILHRLIQEDKSWRVRIVLAENIVPLADCVTNEVFESRILPAYVGLLKDNEGEVKAAAANRLSEFCSKLPFQSDTNTNIFVRMILPEVQTLISSDNIHVKQAIAKEILGVAPILGKEGSIIHLIPIFQQQLRDENSEVRLNIIKNINRISNIIGIKILSDQLLPPIIELAKDKKWRVRIAILDYMTKLAEQLGREFFDANLAPICMQSLSDPVFAIRDKATYILADLSKHFGTEWCDQNVIPEIIKCSDERNYLFRMNSLSCIQKLAKIIDGDVVNRRLVPIVIPLANDATANVRFTAVITIKMLLDVVDKSTIDMKFRPIVEGMIDDGDVDCRDYAKEALNAMNRIFFHLISCFFSFPWSLFFPLSKSSSIPPHIFIQEVKKNLYSADTISVDPQNTEFNATHTTPIRKLPGKELNATDISGLSIVEVRKMLSDNRVKQQHSLTSQTNHHYSNMRNNHPKTSKETEISYDIIEYKGTRIESEKVNPIGKLEIVSLKFSFEL
ncbi:hypothetical protein SNEBB_006917 [Seison nebaliae]|nr:hypothetical protein SNEBB_006917 [Seison nebaliae]